MVPIIGAVVKQIKTKALVLKCFSFYFVQICDRLSNLYERFSKGGGFRSLLESRGLRYGNF